MNEKTNTEYRFFICYRRDDNQDFVEHIRSWLIWHHGRDNVFMDYDSIPGGVDWEKYIRKEIKLCDALIIIIGPDWLERIKNVDYRIGDPVRFEIKEAFKQKKLVYPICIKGAKLPDRDLIPIELQDILKYQATFLNSGKEFTDQIEAMLKSIEGLLISRRASRKKEIEDMSNISFAPGLALAYYHNFLKTIGEQLVLFNDNSRREASSIKVSIDNKQVDTRLPLKIDVVIPNRIDILTKSLEGIKDTLSRAEIDSPRRKFHLYARKVNGEYALIDFPTTITALENWLKRRLKKGRFKEQSVGAKKLELEELQRFEKSLNYWIDDQSNGHSIRSCIQVMQFEPDDPQFDWLTGLLDLR